MKPVLLPSDASARSKGIASAFRSAGLLSILLLSPAARGTAADPLITEILASNRTSYVDADATTPDWIELYNPGPETVDLEGWTVTDDLDDPERWAFPSVDLGPGEFLVVYASGRDLRDPEGALHTNFELLRDGEIVALFDPGGELVSVMGPDYPEQVPDVSYGPRMELEETSVVEAGATARWLVPQDDSLDGLWTGFDFDDSGWNEGPTGLGFDSNSPPELDEAIRTDVGEVMEDENASLFVRLEFEVEDPAGAFAQMRIRYDDGFAAWLNGEFVTSRNTRDPVDWNDRATRRLDADEALTPELIPLGAGGALREGRNVLAIQVLNDSSRGDDLLLLPEIDLVRVLEVELVEPRFYLDPTPGWPHGDGLAAVAPRPSFSQPGGGYTDPVALEFSTPDPDAGHEIRYTLDGSEPDTSSSLYSEPLTIDTTRTVKAKTFAPERVPSPTVTHLFVPLHPSVLQDPRVGMPDGSNLPIMVLRLSGPPNESRYTPCTVGLAYDTESERQSLEAPFTLSHDAALILHGSSSLGFPKNNFRLEFRDKQGEDEDVSVFGLPPHADWVLHGPYSDKSLMRNALAYEWSNKVGRYAPRTRYFELYFKTRSGLLTASEYHGLYVLTERIKRDPNRVAIERVLPSHDSEPEITGGYIFKKDRSDPGEPGFSTGRYQLQHVEPKVGELTPDQRQWIAGWFREFESALYSPNFADPAEGYAKYIDVLSFIDHHILTELCKNIDGYRLSTHMIKRRDGKLHMGPLWDFNLSLGNANYLQGWVPQGWYYPDVSANDYLWYGRLHQDPNYLELYRQRWLQLRGDALATHNLYAAIDRHASLIEEAQERNFQNWRVLGTYVWPNQHIADTWAEEVDWMRNTWLAQRLEWIDSQFIRPPELSHPGGPVNAGLEVSISSPDGPAFYTVNGPDPSTPDGSVDPAAVRWEGDPITIEENTRIRVRTRLGAQGWSALVEATYVTDAPPIVITELMYNPADPEEPDSPYRSSDFEYIEFHNFGDEPVDLQGLNVETTRLRFAFDDGEVSTLEPGGYVLVVRNEEGFRSRYGAEPVVAGEYRGILSNSRMDLLLLGRLGEPLLDFRYEDWYPATDGEGYSMVIRDPTADRSTWNLEESWRPSEAIHGSPGRADGGGGGPGLQRPGDLNQDGRLGLSDAVALLGYLFRGSTELPCTTEAGNRALLDSSGDGRIDLTDPVHNLNYLFLDGAPPASGTDCVPIEGCPQVEDCAAGN